MNVLMMYEPSPSHLHNLQSIAPNASFHIATNEAVAIQQIEKAEVVLGNRYFLQSLPYARQLQWMQSNSVGVELILEKGGTALDNIILTCCRGVYDNEIADHALALILSLFRGIHWACDNQSKRHWKRCSLPSLTGKRALILGWGRRR